MATLDCGHENDFLGDSLCTGCRDASGRSLCRACALANEHAALREDPRFFAYVRLEGDRVVGVKTWLGASIGEVRGSVRESRGNIARKLVTFRVRDVFGGLWACRYYPQTGDYVRMTRIAGGAQ